jgi:hypothetical protein
MLVGLDNRFGQPRPDVALAPRAGGGQRVDRHSTHARGKRRAHVANLAIGAALQPTPCFLDHVLGVADTPEQAVGGPQQVWPQSLKLAGLIESSARCSSG